jgi:N-acetylmuramoyl-L-alanine amidase
MSCGPSARGDVVSIPYLEPVPYEVFPDPDGKRLVVTLFGVESAATWVTHRKGCRVVDKLTWEQSTPETFRVYVNLKSGKIWGYDIRPAGRSLMLTVRYAPVFDPAGEKPLAGLKIAIEAGHGGSNSGAIGLSGLVEKDINLDLSFRLGELCDSMGAEVLQVRESDVDMTLLDKRDKAIKAGADMLISIHANAGGTGYLSVEGTSTYWHNPFWAPLAQTIYDRMLETGLAEFGVVGSFNYTVTRASQMPAVLVEQAFMSHAEDEEKLADPEFRQLMAVKIFEGMVGYLKIMQE